MRGLVQPKDPCRASSEVAHPEVKAVAGHYLAGTFAAAAEWLQIPEDRVHELVDSGALRTVKLGKDERIPVVAMVSYLRSIE